MDQNGQVIEQTKNWIREVVVACNFCPFAARELGLDRVRYQVEPSQSIDVILRVLGEECLRLDREEGIGTTLLILPAAVPRFDEYLTLVNRAERLMRQKGYEGIYQLASFHPLYRFAGSGKDDAANYTNRSIYPILHLLRESEIDKALAHYPDPEGIPGRNIKFAREKGVDYMKMLREACL